MPNIHGFNGVDNGTRPDDETLRNSLFQYARSGLKLPERISRLEHDHGYNISLALLKKLNRKFEVPTVRKPLPAELSRALIHEKVDEDVRGLNGPNSIKTKLALEAFPIPRDAVRQYMRDYVPLGSALRNPRAKIPKPRKALSCPGVFYEIHADGHEKLSKKALKMGSVGIDIYGFRDKCSGVLLHWVAVPNARDGSAIGHIYLNMIEEHGMFPIQATTDKGVETNDFYACQFSLRKNLTPHVDLNEIKPFVMLYSTDNLPIEGAWSQWQKQVGLNIKEVLLQGHTNGIFIQGSELHRHLFHWLWPKIVQLRLNEHMAYWNNHRVRTQHQKIMASNFVPSDLFARPQGFGLENYGMPVPKSIIDGLRMNISAPRKDALRWVPDDFDTEAEAVYLEIGHPALDLRRGWSIFGEMVTRLEERLAHYA